VFQQSLSRLANIARDGNPDEKQKARDSMLVDAIKRIATLERELAGERAHITVLEGLFLKATKRAEAAKARVDATKATMQRVSREIGAIIDAAHVPTEQLRDWANLLGGADANQ
jgi:hypothetical protein